MEWDTVNWVLSLALVLLTVGLSLTAAAHALLRKRDPRAAALWVGFIAFTPLIGAVAYFLFGVNRIHRRASSLKDKFYRYSAVCEVNGCSSAQMSETLGPTSAHLIGLAQAMSRILPRPLLSGNRIEALEDGDQAYPAMLEAIGAARRSVALSVYIFDRDEAGRAFVEALADAARRGVEVRVLVDAAGTRYSWPPIQGLLRRARIPYALFLPTFPHSGWLSINMRNHRKILVADGAVGFTGGMNIRAGHWRSRDPRHPVRDLHFRIDGPVVSHLQEAFVDDWQFSTGEALRGELWFPRLDSAGPVLARGITDGPDEDFETLHWTLLAALGAARSSVRIATPYFLPDLTLIAALNLAALRGVKVDILLPENNNLPFVHWASRAGWWQVLKHGCRIWLNPPPFDHTKLFVIDEGWALVGSTNWDPRSLRLNFEFNVECYNPAFAAAMAERFDRLVSRARPVTLAEADARRFPARLRDGLARLFTPFL